MIRYKANLANWIINYNDITNNWRGVKRDNQIQLFNGGPDRLSATTLETLIEIISKTDGDKVKIKKLIK